VIYRPYNPEDFDQLYALEEVCFEPPFRFSRRAMRAFVQHPDSATWVAEENGRMAGFAIVEWSVRKGECRAYVQTIEVAPEDRRRGVGEELLNWIECSASGAGASSIWLHVEAENAGAVRLYEAQGYRCQGRKENFYPLGQAALIYMKEIDTKNANSILASAADQDSSVNTPFSGRG
jgi:ribosomal-protein-alanine N-acetyltransferase